MLIGAGLAASLQPLEVPVLASCTPAAVMVPPNSFANPTPSSLSSDGRYFAFDSSTNTLVPNDTNGVSDVFVFDRLTCLVDRVSVTSAEEQFLNGGSFGPAISHDGRYVAYYSSAINIFGPGGDPLGFADVFVRDRHTGLTLHASPAFGGGLAHGDSQAVAISGDGRFVAFWSEAADLIASDTNGQRDLFVRDMQSGTTTRVTVAPGGVQSPGSEDDPTVLGPDLFRPVLSSDGRYVAFSSFKADLVPGDTNNRRDVFRRDLQSATTIRVSLASGGVQASGASTDVAMSRDGRYVAFSSVAPDLAGTDPDTASDVFIHDVVSSMTTLVSVDSQGMKRLNSSQRPSLSGDGRYVAFQSRASLAYDFFHEDLIYVRDLTTGITRIASVSETGVLPDEEEPASWPALSDDGAFVSFHSSDGSLVPGVFGHFYVSSWQAVSAPQNVNLLHNTVFASGLDWWTPFALPQPDDLVWNTTGGVLNFHRAPGSAQAVVFQATHARLPPFAPLQATFQLRNTSASRKRISVLIHDRDFTDLSVCTFWLDPGTSLQSYSMRMHTTRFWSDATLSLYAATADGTPAYGVDNVTLTYNPFLSDSGTDCIDPTGPFTVGLPPGPNLLINGDFSAGLPPWGVFGQIVPQIAGGVFEFYRPPGQPAGVVFQNTGQPLNNNTILTASFSLGNSSNVRKRVTVLIHDADFSDLSACTFWLPPQLALTTYSMRLFTTEAWTNTTMSVYGATIGTEPWIRLDDVTLRTTMSALGNGTSCMEPDLNPRPAARPSSLANVSAMSRPPDVERRRITVDAGGATATGAPSSPSRFTAGFWLPPHDESLEVEITVDGQIWTTVARLDQSDEWTFVELDAPAAVQVRVRSVR